MVNITNYNVGIAFPITWTHIHTDFFDSWIKMKKPNFTYIRDFGGTGAIDQVRNNLVRTAMAANCSHLFMLDTDQVYPENTIPKLLSYNLPIVGGLVHRRYPPFDPLIMKGDINTYETIDEWEKDELLEVDATGTGCILYDMKIFYNMPEPWFRFRENPDPKKRGRVVGEDVGFCNDLRKAGYKIFVDTSIRVVHLSTIEIDENAWRLYRRLNELQIEENRKNGFDENGEDLNHN
jgi:hypothetical protein